MSESSQPPGWYPAEGDPPGTVRWWDGDKWVGGPQQQGAQQQAGYVAPGVGTLANGRELADPWLRIAARIIDFVVMFLAALPLVGAQVVSAINDSGNDGITVTTGIGVSIAAGVIAALYFGLMNTFLGGTVGKLLLGIRIVKADGSEPLGTPTGPMRSLMNILGIITPIPVLGWLATAAVWIVGLVSLVFLFTDPEHRTVMDRVANTYVVKKQ